MEELPLKSCINLLQIQHPVFNKNNNNLNQSDTNLQRLDTQDLFSGKKPYFLLEQFVMTLEPSKQPQKLSQLRQQNKDLEKKLAQSQEFFDIPDDRNNLLEQPQIIEKLSQSPPINLPSQPAMYHPSVTQQPQMPRQPIQTRQQFYPGPPQQQAPPQRYYTNQPLAPSYQQNIYVNQRPPVRRGLGVGLALGLGMRGRGGFRGFGFGHYGRGGRYC